MNITLEPMTQELAHLFYKDFTYDPATFSTGLPLQPFMYTPDWVDAYYDKQLRLQRIHLAIIQEYKPVGEILLKNIDLQNRSCVFSIHLQNDNVKGQGIGTNAATQALTYAFDTLNMKTVFADALIRNLRSRHVLEKVGYQEIRRDQAFCYYRYNSHQYYAQII